MLRLKPLLFSLLALLGASAQAEPESCGRGTQTVQVQLRPEELLRAQVPPGLFGFDLPWYDAQIGYVRRGALRPELLEWLKPFKGAMYRYPAGSNSFEWRKAVGPRAARQPVGDPYAPGGRAIVELGPEEFLRMMATVDGQPLWMLNLYGAQGRVFDDGELLRENVGYAQWIQAASARWCAEQSACQRASYEFGNELDWSPVNWNARQYVDRSLPLLRALRKAQPGARLLVLGQTAPWDARSQTAATRGFDAAVAAQLATLSDGVTIHPYYDGHSIPVVNEYLDRLLQRYRAVNKDQQVYVTEHARWPGQPLIGRWEDNWYQASGSGGGVSSADFLLSLIPKPGVGAAMWHALGVQGPWQLIKWDRRNDSLYPSPAYWALRVLREALLDDAIGVRPALFSGRHYAGGYDLRLVAMRGADGRLSLMGVNRSDKSYVLQPRVNRAPAFDPARLQLRRLVADERGSDNTDEDKQRFVMQLLKGEAAQQAGGICVPAQSVFSVTDF